MRVSTRAVAAFVVLAAIFATGGQSFTTPKRTTVLPSQRQSALRMASQVATRPAEARKGLLVGKMASNLSKLLWISPRKAKAVKSAVSQTVQVNEVAVICFSSWALRPIVRYLYTLLCPEGDFQKSYYNTIPLIISQLAQICGVVYIIDILTVVLGVLGFQIPKDFNMCLAKTFYLLYGAYRLTRFKKHVLIEKRARAGLPNKILNVLIAVVTAFGVMDILSVQTGTTMNSIFALSGAGALIVSLGSQNLATQIVQGLSIASTGKFYEGESIVIDDGEKAVRGIVQKIGLMATAIRGSDETVMIIPNQQIAGKRVGNITRGKRSSVSQTVYFSYNDIDKIETVCSDIKMCIKKRCPKLDSETRPFRVNLRDFKQSHLEVVVQSHYTIPPYSNEYFENRQQVLYAIADAAKKNDMAFEIPTVALKTSGNNDIVGTMFDKLGRASNLGINGR